MPCRSEPRGHRSKIPNEDPRMGLPRRPEAVLHTDVDLDPGSPEPHAATGGEDRRLGHLDHAKSADVEITHQSLRAVRRGELHVMNAGYRTHRLHSFRACASHRPMS